MKAVEFEGVMTPGGQIVLPPDVVCEIPAGEQIRVVLLWNPSNLDSGWQTAGRQRFEAAYCPEDAVYERLIDDPADR